MSSTQESPAHDFAELMKEFLKALCVTFHDNITLKTFKMVLKTSIIGDAEEELKLVQRWDYDMRFNAAGTPRSPQNLYTATLNADAATVLSSGIQVLDHIGARDLYFSTEIDDSDRASIVEFLNELNALAFFINIIPIEAQKLVAGMAMGAEFEDDSMSSVDVFMAMAQEVMKNDSAEGIVRGFQERIADAETQDNMRRLLPFVSQETAMGKMAGLLVTTQESSGDPTALMSSLMAIINSS